MRYLVGVGNYYGFDDSIGLRIAEAIGEPGTDCGFRAFDLGGNLLDLVHYLDPEVEEVLVVDSARMGMAPGEYRFFTPDQVSTGKELAGISTHEGDLMKVLALAASLGGPLPPITVMGIEAERIESGYGLSPELERRFGEYIEAAIEFLSR